MGGNTITLSSGKNFILDYMAGSVQSTKTVKNPLKNAYSASVYGQKSHYDECCAFAISKVWEDSIVLNAKKDS